MKKALQILQDSSEQDPASDSYEQRIIRDNDFEKVGDAITEAIEIETLEWVLSLNCHTEYIKEAVRDRVKEIKTPESNLHPLFDNILKQHNIIR